MAKRLCKCGCGESLAGLDKRRQFLNDTHRKRVGRGSKPAAPTGPVSTDIADRLRAHLHNLGVLDSHEAQIVLWMAKQMDEGAVQGTASTSISKEIDRRVDALRLKADLPDNPISKLEASMAEKQTHLRLA